MTDRELTILYTLVLCKYLFHFCIFHNCKGQIKKRGGEYFGTELYLYRVCENINFLKASAKTGTYNFLQLIDIQKIKYITEKRMCACCKFRHHQRSTIHTVNFNVSPCRAWSFAHVVIFGIKVVLSECYFVNDALLNRQRPSDNCTVSRLF